MATKTDFRPLADAVVTALGGPDNIRSVTHCATRLRFKIKDAAKVDDAGVEKQEGVITLVKAGGQHQVVIGNDVALAYEAIVGIDGMAAKAVKEAADDEDEGPQGSLFNRLIDLISSLFSPILWCLSGIALLKAFLAMSVQFGWIDAEGTNYLVLNAMADAVFYFLPLYLALTAARKFKVNDFIALSVVAPLVYPTVVALGGVEEPVTLFGLPLVTMSYASSVIPAILAVWLTGYLQRWLEKVLPGAIRTFGTPLLCVLIMVPLVLFTVGPITMVASNGISSGIAWLFEAAPWLAGALMGGFWQVLVMFGLHWGFVPVFLNDIATQGYSAIMAVLMAPVLAQGAAAAAVFLRSKVAARRKVAGPATVSAILAGVTEPVVYGVNLPLKIPFYLGCVGGAIGGAIIGMGGVAFNTFVFPSVLATPAMLGRGNLILAFIGIAVAMIVAFVGTWLAMPRLEKQEAAAVPDSANGADSTTIDVPLGTTAILLPVRGEVIPLDQVNDKVFASGAMGTGLAVLPADGDVIAPISGTVIAAPKSGHAYGIKSPEGIEVLVHVGLDTVAMKGEGFTPHVVKGDVVKAGQPLVTADLAAIAAAGYEATTLLVVTNSGKLAEVRSVAPNVSSLAGEAGILVTP
ncbi:PTS system beta-glucoside-specific EIIBCA component [Corynebacterium atrinae]|uniref:beta-glucoside-specific PTS transporter subunit IIABC n=1 Tax=Corynebacterium atrinae TaxID=1336740 RepID=UPI0025B5FB76|nr:beta-glucoside-specific PTS transporter subunit IIABC [Corynebacterium atrinae]WJY64098.1 PTS system beta-glucoside-specific EIIBCA component [Corynebacterium atrinae]